MLLCYLHVRRALFHVLQAQDQCCADFALLRSASSSFIMAHEAAWRSFSDVCLDPVVYNKGSDNWNIRFVHFLYDVAPEFTRADKTMLRLTAEGYFDDEKGKASGWLRPKQSDINGALGKLGKVDPTSKQSRVAFWIT